MTLTATASLVGLAVAALVAWRLGGPAGTGVLAGFLGASAITGWGILRQRRVLSSAPERALRVMVESFLVKLALVLVATLALLFIPSVRAVLDAAGFLLAFAGGALVILVAGTIDNARILKARRAR